MDTFNVKDNRNRFFFINQSIWYGNLDLKYLLYVEEGCCIKYKKNKCQFLKIFIITYFIFKNKNKRTYKVLCLIFIKQLGTILNHLNSIYVNKLEKFCCR